MSYHHSRVYVEPDDNALMSLSCYEYKTLRYLVNRADDLGISFPTTRTIFLSIGGQENQDDRHVHRALERLIEQGYVAYVRRDAVDPVTRRKLPNAYIVNPAYICLPDSTLEQARIIWKEVASSALRVRVPCDSGVTLTNRINTNDYLQELTPETSPGIHPQEPTPTTSPAFESAGQGQKAKDKKQRAKGKERQPAQQTGEQPQHQYTPAPHSAPPPSPYRDVERIAHALPDRLHELLAEKLRRIGIAMPLARGFVVEYGDQECERALLQVQAAMQHDEIRRPGGFFRKILQAGLIDEQQGVLTAGEAVARNQYFEQREIEYENLRYDDVDY